MESKTTSKLGRPESQRDKQLPTSLVAIVSDKEEEDANEGTERDNTGVLGWFEY